MTEFSEPQPSQDQEANLGALEGGKLDTFDRACTELRASKELHDYEAYRALRSIKSDLKFIIDTDGKDAGLRFIKNLKNLIDAAERDTNMT